MKNLFVLFVLTFVLASCSKDAEQPIKEMSSPNFKENGSDKIVTRQKQTFVVEGISYEVWAKGHPDSSTVTFEGMPAIVEQFMLTYDSTLQMHAVLDKDNTTIYLYKNAADYDKNVVFLDSQKSSSKSYLGGDTYAYEHANRGGFSLKGECRTFGNYALGIAPNLPFISGWGSTNNSVGSKYNDKISEVVLYLWDQSEPLHYIFYEHDNKQGRRFAVTKGTISNWNVVQMWNLVRKRCWFRWCTWNDAISSFEQVQARVVINGAPII